MAKPDRRGAPAARADGADQRALIGALLARLPAAEPPDRTDAGVAECGRRANEGRRRTPAAPGCSPAERQRKSEIRRHAAGGQAAAWRAVAAGSRPAAGVVVGQQPRRGGSAAPRRPGSSGRCRPLAGRRPSSPAAFCRGRRAACRPQTGFPPAKLSTAARQRDPRLAGRQHG